MLRGVVFVNRKLTGNIGDRLSSPLLYFKQQFPAARHVDVHFSHRRRDRVLRKGILAPILGFAKLIVIGGGGFFGHVYFGRDMEFWGAHVSCPKLIWGVGHNSGDFFLVDPANPSLEDYATLSKFDKVGLRDWGIGANWVPCASCLHPELSRLKSECGGIVAAPHCDSHLSETFIPAVLSGVQEPVDVVFNDADPETFIGKLRSAKAVVTNSFHAAYWSILLGKRVAVVGGGSKVRLLKHPPVLASVNNWAQELEKAEIYPHALEECRDRNLEYSAEIDRSYR